jgi:Na+/H+ antiporter NhaC
MSVFRNRLISVTAALIIFVSISSLALIFSYRTPSAYWYSIIPPLFAIVSVFVLRNVAVCLGMAVVIGGFLIDPVWGLLKAGQMLGRIYLEWGNLEILLMVVFFLAFVSVLIGGGGFQAIINNLEKKIKDARSAQLVTALLGFAVFIDGYANTMIVGSMTRLLTDRYMISREKFAFLVDATSAPIAGLAVVSTWIAFEIGLFEQMNQSLALGSNGYAMFITALPYRFYCIFMLAFVFVNILSGKDFGTMRKAQIRAQKEGLVSAPDAKLPTTKSFSALKARGDIKLNPWTALIPITCLFIFLISGCMIWGLERAMTVLFSASVLTLVSSILCARVLAGMNLRHCLLSTWDGVKGSFLPIVILTLAWGLKNICQDLNSAKYLIETLGHLASPLIFPATVFAFSALVAFSIGTSWGTMSILIPILVPFAHELDGGQLGITTIITLAAILDGAVFGDHSSPISDTTIMSSVATNCDHIHHVRTQLPYALTIGGLALVSGYLPAAFGLPPVISWVAAIIAMILFALTASFPKPSEVNN